MSKPVTIAYLLFVTVASQISAFEIGDRVVTALECELKEEGVVIRKAWMGEQFLVQGVDGRRLLLGSFGTVWVDDADFLTLEGAVEHFTRLIKKDPSDWQALCARGRAREELGLSYAGMGDLDEAVRLNPSCETYRRRAGAYANRGMNQRALADFDEEIRRDGRSVETLRDRAMVFCNTGKHEKSLADMNKVVEIEPASANLLSCRGMMLLKNKEPEKALVDADATLRLVPTYSYAVKLRGYALHQLNRNQEAAAEFSKVLRSHPRDVEALLKRGTIWENMGTYDKAITDFTKGIALLPTPSASAYSGRGFIYMKAEDLPRAEDDLDQAVKLDPKQPMTRLMRGLVRFERGDTQKAIQDFDVAIQLDPNGYQNYVARMQALGKAGRKHDALQDGDVLVRLQPDSAASYFYRGGVYRSLGKWDEAIADLDRALKLDPNDAAMLAEAAYLRAACPVEKLRNPTVAVTLARKAVLSKEESKYAHGALAAAHAAQGDFAKAMESKKHALKLAKQDEKDEEQERLSLYQARKPFRFK